MITQQQCQARIDNALPDDDMPEIDGLPVCRFGHNEWRLSKRGTAHDDPVFECCVCGVKL